MRLYIILGIVFLLKLNLHSQTNISEDLINDIEKNILIYRVNNLDLRNVCTYGKPLNFDKLLPSKNQTLSYNMILDSLTNYNSDVTLFKLSTKYYFLEEKKLKNGSFTYNEVKFQTSDDINIYNEFLVGYSRNDKKLIYISGDFFKSCIAENFNLNENKPNSFKQFLKLKLYNYSIEKISFQKNKKKFMLFKAYSNKLNEDIHIKVNPDDFDMLQVKTVNSNWTEKGSYKWKKKW